MIGKRWLLVGVVLILSGCGNSTASGSATNPSASGNSAHGVVSSVSSINSKYGQILASSSGHTYYMFEPDTSKTSACYGACAGVWPPVTVAGSASPPVTGNANKALVGTIVRTDGTKQVTYNGHPLYTFTGDSGPNLTNGQGIDHFGGYWYVMGVDGSVITSAAGGTSPSSTGASGSLY